MNMTGRCLCGAVSFTANDVDPAVHACHCRICQRWLGGPALGVNAGSIGFDGHDAISTFDSSDWAERGFCSKCGSSLFYRLKQQNRYILFAGTLDDPSAVRLEDEIFVDAKPSGYDFAGDHRRLTGEQFWQSIQQQQQ